MKKLFIVLLFGSMITLTACDTSTAEGRVGEAIKDVVVDFVAKDLGIESESLESIVDSVPVDELKEAASQLDEEDMDMIKEGVEGISDLLSEENLGTAIGFIKEMSESIE